MTARIGHYAWMTLAGGWLVVFAITAGVANLARAPRPRCHPGESAA